jgi:hypothetical protein
MTLFTVLVFPTGGALAAVIGPIDCVTPGQTLQEAINAASNGDTIIIADASTCAGNFDVNRPLTIRAATAAGATLDGLGVNAGPVVSVTTGAAVTLQDLTITGGINAAPNSGYGGGVFVGGAAVTIVDSTITGNSADSGAGIYSGGTLVVDGGAITGNTSIINGGGVFSNLTATLSGVSIGTAAQPNTAGDGGGVYNQSPGNMTIDSATVIDSNTATAVTGGGGGIWNDGTLALTNAVVNLNVATDAGGGIDNISGGTLTITNSEITRNSAKVAGGVLNNGTGGSTASFTNSLVSLNAATGVGPVAGGGGIYSNFGAVLTVTDTEVSDNTSAAEGAAGIRNDVASATLDGATVTGNDAVGNGGGIRTSGTMVITDSTIDNNTATTSGAGIALDGSASTLTVVGSTLDMNDAGTEGGGLAIGLEATADLDESSVTNSSAGAGAGIANAGTLELTNSTVSGNVAVTQGGGVMTSGNATITHATITDNSATGEGGGVRVIGLPVVTLTGTILDGNVAGSGLDCSGVVGGGGFNLVGNTAAPCTYTGTGSDLPALSDPMLGPLTAGVTDYHPLLAGSDAIDAGGACGLATDQIGATRPNGPSCDVGAIEGASVAPPVVADEVVLVEPNGRWHIRVPGNPDYTFFYGDPGDIPLFGDWDGDGDDTPGAWRQGAGGGFAYLTNTLPPNAGVGVADFDFFFGDPGDEVFSGDWNGDNTDTLGINRAGHIFLTDTNGSGGLPVPTDYDFFFGVPGDRAFGGDGDGDGDDGVFLYRETDGFVYYTNQTPTTGVAPTAANFFFGIASDSFVSGDWNANLVDTAGIFRGSNGTIYLSNTNASGGAPAPTDVTIVWGTNGWIPLAGVTGLP